MSLEAGRSTLVSRWSRPGLPIPLLAAGVISFGFLGGAEGGVVHVSPSGTDSAACGTQVAPCRNLDYAANKALDGETLRVAGGTYLYAGIPNLCAGTTVTSVVCVAGKSLSIQGGYAPADWTLNPAAFPTRIDGQNTYRGVHVFSLGGPTVRLTMTNVTIQNGLAQAPQADPSAFGGGMSVDVAAVTLDNVAFLANRAAGAATGSGAGGAAAGGGLSIRSSPAGAVSFLTNLSFVGNTSVGGQGPERGGYAFGALFVFASTVQVANALFASNSAQGGSSPGSGQDSSGARADALGGAIGLEGAASASLTGLLATSNQVTGGVGTQYGGGGFGGAVFVEDSAATIADSRFQSNISVGANSVNGGVGFGGGVLFFNSNGTIDRTHILANRATGGNSSAGQPAGTPSGGGLYLWRGAPPPLSTFQLRNVVIAGNSLGLGTGVNPGGGGGGLMVQGLSAELSHVTLARNQLGPGLVAGQALVVVEAPGVSTASATLSHSIVADHVAATPGAVAIWVSPTNTLALVGGAFSGNTTNTGGGGTIAGSMPPVGPPSFVSAGPPYHDYHINSASPLRDSATGSVMPVDVDGQARSDGLPDIGADEYGSDLIFRDGFQ